jgi:hypothetical protein
MDSNLESILSEQATETTTTEATEQAAETQQATEQTQETGNEATGEQEGSAAPAEQHTNDPLDKASQGLKAAAVAERQKRQEAERKAQEAVQRAQALEQQLQALNRPQQQQKDEDAKPTRAQFQSEDEWLDARDAWRDRQREKEAQEQQAKDRLTFLQQTAEETVRRGQEQFTDFDAVINAGLGPVLTPVLQQTLFLSERGHEVAYFLGKNPQEARRVAGMPPLMLARELALIEARLTAPQQERRELPESLSQARDTRGRFSDKAYSGPTPLDAILATTR